MRTKACVAVLLLALGVGAAGPVFGADGEKPETIQTRIKRVALFKNGLGFFVREGTLPSARETLLLGPLAAPAHGSFWVACPSTAELKSVVSRSVKVKESVPAYRTADLLRGNIGKQVVLGAPWTDSALTGIILSMGPERTLPPRPGGDYRMGSVWRDDGGGSQPPQYMLFETAAGEIVVIDPNQYSRVYFPDCKPSTSYEQEVEKVELRATFAKQPKAGDWLSVSYLAKGITWAPSYLIDISDAKHARLSAQALIINEVEDLDGVTVDLITGFPNLAFSDVTSPMAHKQNLAAFLNALASRGSRIDALVASNVMAQSAEFTRAGRGGGGGAMGGGGLPSYGSAATGQAAEDLFLYPVDDVRLAVGETGSYPLFTEAVPYTQFYEWEIPDYIAGDERYRGDPRGEGQPEVVWHSIKLTNETKVPWTTAPAQLMKAGQIIGQDVLRYTPATAKSTVRITQAVSVKAEQIEREVSRQPEEKQRYGHWFDRVTIEGILQITNHKADDISLEVKKTLSGQVKSATHEPEDTTLARGLARINPIHELVWTIALKPGQTEEVKYTYEAMIQR